MEGDNVRWMNPAEQKEVLMTRSARTVCCLLALAMPLGLSCFAADGPGSITSYPLGTSFETIQEAIDASIDGSTIVIREGDYFESLVIGKSLTLLGIGEVRLTHPDPEPAFGEAVLRVLDAKGVTVENLTIVAADIGIEMRRSSCAVLGCTIEVGRHGLGVYVEARGSEAIRIHQCDVLHPKAPLGGDGVAIIGAGSVVIAESTFTRLGNGVVSGSLTTALIRDCSFIGCYEAILLPDVSESTLIGNRLEGSLNVALSISWTPQLYPGGLVGALALVDNVFLGSSRWDIDLCSESDDGARHLLFEGPIVGSGNVFGEGAYGYYGPYCPPDYTWPAGFFADQREE